MHPVQPVAPVRVQVRELGQRTDLEQNYGDVAPRMRTVGVFRHELGHILGLRHEHTRSESGRVLREQLVARADSVRS